MTHTLRSISPYLGYPDADAAAAWLQAAFGFGPTRVARDANGAWEEGEITVGDSTVYLTGKSPMDPGTGTGALLIVHVDAIDDLYRRAVDAGVELEEPRESGYGPRVCNATDPWGYRWYFWEGAARYPNEEGPL